MSSNNISVKYNVDIVFCIDATGSMYKLIDMVKKNALNFYGDVQRAMVEKRKVIQKMRLRIVAFRDYVADGDDAMLTTDFFELPESADLFSRCINSITAFGGGDDPEDGLEALAFAIRSKWLAPEPGIKNRRIIVVWTDAPTHDLGFGSSCPNYPSAMPRTFAELSSWWGNEQGYSEYLDGESKRLVLFAPKAAHWNTIADNWDNVVHFMSSAGKGCTDRDYEQIINILVQTLG